MGCRGCVILLAIVVLIFAFLIGGTIYLLIQPSPIVADMPALLPSKDAADAFDRKVNRFLSDVKVESRYEDFPVVILEVTEEEATSKLEAAVVAGQLPFALVSPQVHFRNHRIQASANLDLFNYALNTVVEAGVEIQDGKPDVVIERLDLGRISVPGFLRQIILEAIASGADSSKLQDLPFYIEGISIENGVLTISGTRPQI